MQSGLIATRDLSKTLGTMTRSPTVLRAHAALQHSHHSPVARASKPRSPQRRTLCVSQNILAWHYWQIS